MSKYNLTYFNEIDLDHVEDCYEAEVAYDGRTIDIDVNVDADTINKSRLAIVEKFIAGIARYDDKALAAIAKDFKTAGIVKEYIEDRIDVLNDDELNTLLKNSDKNLSTQHQMAAIVHLVRIGFYPDSDEGFAVFDYTIDKDLTDYLVVVKFTERGKIESILTES